MDVAEFVKRSSREYKAGYNIVKNKEETLKHYDELIATSYKMAKEDPSQSKIQILERTIERLLFEKMLFTTVYDQELDRDKYLQRFQAEIIDIKHNPQSEEGISEVKAQLKPGDFRAEKMVFNQNLGRCIPSNNQAIIWRDTRSATIKK
jgi:hypothetical protein